MTFWSVLRNVFVSVFAGTVFLGATSALAASGTWNGTNDNMWTNNSNWSASPYPSGGNTATFDNAGNGRTSLDLAGLWTLMNMTFTGSSVAAYTLGSAGQKVTLQDGGTILLAADAANSQTVAAALELPLSNSQVTFRNDNPAQVLTLGKVHGYVTAGATKTVYVRGTGPIALQGDLDSYLSGLIVYQQTTNSLTLNGDAKLTQLYLDGTNAVLTIASGKTMTFSNAGLYNILASQDATINGPGAIVLSAGTGDNYADNAVATGRTLTINATLTGNTGFEFWHGSFYGTIVLNGVNDYTRNTAISAPGTIQCSAIGNKGVAGNLGAGTNIFLNAIGGRLRYTGAGETTDRTLDVKAGGIIEHAGTGTLVFTAPTASSSSGAKTLTLRNSAAAAGVFSGAVQNGAGTVSLTKEGDGTWSLTASNTFSGTLAVNGGTLALSGANGSVTAATACTVSNGATLLLDNTAAVNNTNRLNDAGTVTLLGGTVDFSHNAGDADFSETTGDLTAGSGACTVQADQAADGKRATLTFSSLSRLSGATLNFAGTGLGENDRNRVFITGQPEGLLENWVTLNGQPAYYSDEYGVTAPPWGVTEIAARGPDSVIPDNASADVRITQPGTKDPITLAGATTNSVARLRQCTDTAAAVDTANKTLLAYSIGITNGQATLTLGQAVGDGALAPLTPGGSLALDNDSGSALTVNAALADNATASSVAKYGVGNAIIAGPTLHTGATEIHEGTLTFAGHDVTQRLAGAVSGNGTLAKTGTNLLDLTAASTFFTGPMLIQDGIVRAAQTGALGTADGGTVISAGAALDVGGAASPDSLDMRGEPVTVQGAGPDGLGAIVNNSSVQQTNALGNIELSGGTTFGGTARWDIRNGTLNMNNHAITKVGSSTVGLSGTTIVTPGGDAAAIDVQEGTLRLQQSTLLNGSSNNVVHLCSGTTLDFYDLAASPAWSLVCDGNARYNVDNSAAGTHNRWGGPVTLNGTLNVHFDGAFNGALIGDVSGTGSVYQTVTDKNLQPRFAITGTNNTFSGSTRVVGGWLQVNSLRNVGEPCSLGQPMTIENGTIRLGGGDTPGRLTYQGTGDVTDRVIDMSGTTGWTTLEHVGTGPFVISNLTVSGAGSKILYLLGGSTSTAEIVASVVNSSSGNTSLEKQNPGTWILTGNNTYSGGTTVQDGTLNYMGNNTLAGATTLNKGTLNYMGNNTLAGATTLNNGRINYFGTNALAGTLDVRNGTVTLFGTNTYGSSAAIYVGNLTNNGVLKLGAGSAFTCANNVHISQANSFGALYLDGGSFSNAQGAGEHNFSFGCEMNSYGYLRMTGGRVNVGRLQTGGYLGSAAFGISVLRITDGQLRFPEWVILGRTPGCRSAITLDGGTFTHSGTAGELTLCRNGGYCEFHVTGGTLNNTDGNMTFHSSIAGGTGIVNLCAGRINVRGFGTGFGGSSYLMLSGGTLAASADQTAFVPSSMTGVYSFGAFGSFDGGTTVDSNGKNIAIPAAIRAPTGQGVSAITLAAQGSGYIGEPYVQIEGDGAGATAVANLADDGKGKGTFKIASITMTCPGVNYTVAPTVTLRGGGTNVVSATIDAVTLAANASGGLTKTGAGTLTLSGTNTYSGATTVSNGTLYCASAGALPTGTDLTLADGAIDLGGFTRTNGAVTATAGAIMGGSLIADSFIKTGDGALTLATSLQTEAPIVIQGGTLRLVTASPGLYEGPLAGAFNTTENMSTNILVQLTTRAANVNAYPPWGTNMTYVYTGYLWNRAETNVTWTFGENIDDSALLKIDGTTLLNNGTWNAPTITNYTLAPGAHAFEARFGNSLGNAGKNVSAWWTTTAFGFGVDYQGRNETNIANFVALTDPGDGSLLTVASNGTSNQLAAASSVEIATGALLDLAGTAQTLSGLSGSGAVSNGTLAVTGNITPGGDGTLGALAVVDGSVAGTGTLRIDVTAGGLCDRLEVDGSIDLSGLALEIANPAALDRTRAYTVLTCAGTRTGQFAATNLPDSRWHVVYRADGSAQLLFTGGTLIRIR